MASCFVEVCCYCCLDRMAWNGAYTIQWSCAASYCCRHHCAISTDCRGPTCACVLNVRCLNCDWITDQMIKLETYLTSYGLAHQSAFLRIKAKAWGGGRQSGLNIEGSKTSLPKVRLRFHRIYRKRRSYAKSDRPESLTIRRCRLRQCIEV